MVCHRRLLASFADKNNSVDAIYSIPTAWCKTKITYVIITYVYIQSNYDRIIAEYQFIWPRKMVIRSSNKLAPDRQKAILVWTNDHRILQGIFECHQARIITLQTEAVSVEYLINYISGEHWILFMRKIYVSNAAHIDAFSIGPVFYVWLSKVVANEWKRHLYNVFL